MIQAVIFDLDDTLVKSHVAKWAQHKAVAKERFGRELTDEKLREHWGEPFDKLIAALHDNGDTVENLRTVYASTADNFPKQLQEDSLATIKVLLDKNIRIGIVTATLKEFLVRDLKRLHVPYEEFFCIQAADETEFHKPDPRVFDPVLEALRQLGITKKETMYVGDALTDLHAARGAGVGFVAVTTGLHSAEEFRAEGAANIIIERLAELPAIIL